MEYATKPFGMDATRHFFLRNRESVTLAQTLSNEKGFGHVLGRPSNFDRFHLNLKWREKTVPKSQLQLETNARRKRLQKKSDGVDSLK